MRKPKAGPAVWSTVSVQPPAAPLTNNQIEDGLRQLVRAEYLVGWYSWMWTEGRHWTLRPAAGGCVTYCRDDVMAYLALAAHVV